MKWTNRGHELDDLGAKYLKMKRIYIWGAGKQGKRMCKLLCWLGLDKDFDLSFIDSESRLWNTVCENFPIISPDEFFKTFNNQLDVLTISAEGIFFELVKKYTCDFPSEYFIDFAERLPERDFLRKFVSVYLMYKKGILLSPHTNYIITTICNLNCRGCLNFNKHIKMPAHESFESFKKHTEVVFSKFDYLASFHFSGGEVLTHKELPRFLRYINDTYGKQIFELFLVTNGTIIPSTELLETMRDTNCGVLLDDYRHSVPLAVKNYMKVKELFDQYGIWYNTAKADYWYDLGISEKKTGENLTEQELAQRCSECNVKYFQDFFDGKIFGCCYIGYVNDMYPNKAAIYTPDKENDYIEITETPKIEILEYRFGYTNKGYFELCRRCNKLHTETSVKIPPAEQLPANERGV